MSELDSDARDKEKAAGGSTCDSSVKQITDI